MTEFKVGDKIVIGKNSIAAPVGTSFLVVEKLKVPGVWIDCTAKEVDVKYVGKGCINSYADFKLAEEERVKNKFAIGDKVISIIDVVGVPEGYIGHVVKIRENSFPIVVRKEGTNDERVFNEDELELLSVGGKEKIQQLKEEARIIFDGLLDKDHPFNRDDITPQDIAGVSKSALDKQVSGNHYKDCKIQPIEYIQANGLSYLEGNVIKYTTRHSKKNGKADIEKAIHYLELILEMEYKDKE